MNRGTHLLLRRSVWTLGLVAWMLLDSYETPDWDHTITRALGFSLLFVFFLDVIVDPPTEDG